MPRIHPNRLLLEGLVDKRVIPEFMEKNSIPWGNDPSAWPVEIKIFGGDGELLRPGIIEAELKTSHLEALGVITDADTDADHCWKRLRQRGLDSFPDLPETLPEQGGVWQNSLGLRFGVWVMPDNRSSGMLETFLHSCVPANQKPLWDFVHEKCVEAKKLGAPFKQVHFDKAKIHAWLALQDEPGQQLHQAVRFNTLKPESPHAAKFVQWFRSLFGV